MFRTRSARKKYKEYLKHNTLCPFCLPEVTKRKIIKKGEFFFVTKSDFPYNFWDGYDVIEHLLVVPYEHIDSLKSLNNKAKIELNDILADYEQSGHNIYARGIANKQKTVPLHQHTHLIKTTGKSAKGILFNKRPYLLIKF
jgi:diadenosine tetraphosphate (Ap4A) HIT family hydrolase